MSGAQVFVGRWHSSEGQFVVLCSQEPGKLRVVVQGYPVMLRRLKPTEARYIKPLDYPVKKAARLMRKMARHNAGKGVRRFLDGVLA